MKRETLLGLLILICLVVLALAQPVPPLPPPTVTRSSVVTNAPQHATWLWVSDHLNGFQCVLKSNGVVTLNKFVLPTTITVSNLFAGVNYRMEVSSVSYMGPELNSAPAIWTKTNYRSFYYSTNVLGPWVLLPHHTFSDPPNPQYPNLGWPQQAFVMQSKAYDNFPMAKD